MSEKIYDELIAPKLLEVAALCKEHKIPLIATCEYEPGQFGSTFGWISTDGTTSLAMMMVYFAVFAKANIDNFIINLLKYCNKQGISTEQSMCIRQMHREPASN